MSFPCNREVTLTTVMTRTKPNCFNYLFQILKKTRIHQSDLRSQYDVFRNAAYEYGLSKAEHDAVENLLLHVSPQTREALSKFASTYGMVRGPITHAGVASKALRSNYLATTDVGFYEDRLGNDEKTVELIIKRIELDFLNVAPGMRTSASDEKVQYLQKCARMFLLYCENLQNKLTPEATHPLQSYR